MQDMGHLISSQVTNSADLLSAKIKKEKLSFFFWRPLKIKNNWIKLGFCKHYDQPEQKYIQLWKALISGFFDKLP